MCDLCVLHQSISYFSRLSVSTEKVHIPMRHLPRGAKKMSKSNVKILEAKLRDLQSLLRKKFGKDFVVISYVAESLLPPGENYGSSILKVHAIVKKSADGKEENLHLVAKMVPPTEIQRTIFNSPHSFKKETFLYEELIPAYQRLELDFGANKDEVFDVVPEFYGARYSLKSDGDFDDDAVILMQNLKVLGYYTGDRKRGLDLEHCKVAVTTLARFHALGIAMKLHNPDFFEKLGAFAKHSSGKNPAFEGTQAFYLQLMREDPEISEHYECLKAIMSQKFEVLWHTPPEETWSTIIHSDFWVNNFMFRKDATTNRVVDIKFIDFQNYHNSSPQRELIFFLMTSLNVDVMANNFDDVIDTYYDAFIAVLERMKLDIEDYNREKFDERIKADAYVEFAHCPILLKAISADIEEEALIDHIESIFSNGAVSKLFRDRLRRCVKKYAEKGWLGN